MSSGACDSEMAYQFALDHLVPLVEQKQKELSRELHVYEVCECVERVSVECGCVDVWV